MTTISLPHQIAAVALTLLCLCSAQQAVATSTVHLSDLDLSQMSSGWKSAQANKTVENTPLVVSGHKFEKGIGTHANSSWVLELNGKAESFHAAVGVADYTPAGKGSVVFRLVADRKTVWKSGIMHQGDGPCIVELPLTGVKMLSMIASGAGDGIEFDHAVWGGARIEMSEGQPKPFVPEIEKAVILTPPAPATPRINGARIYGVRPGHPFLYRIAASGERPMTFGAENLPQGLTVNPENGVISGTITSKEKKNYVVTLSAKNNKGSAQREFKIVVGDKISLTPPMGWNSWNCFAHAVTAKDIKNAADTMVKSGLVNHGWSYINIDDFWEKNPRSKDPTLQGPGRDKDGFIVPNPRFPDMKALIDSIHALGLKAGIYSSPGPLTCGGCLGSWQHEEHDAQRYAEWGVDYLKYDWCSYSKVVPNRKMENLQKPYILMRKALDKQNRDILYSLCQYGWGKVSTWGAKVGGNCWRTTGDIVDTWSSLSHIGFDSQAGLEKYAEPGHWNDPDMLIVGVVGWGRNLHPTRLTPNEQYTHISLWSLLASPLLIGCDMTKLDDFTLSLLTNDEVIDINQDPLGKQAARLTQIEGTEIWAKKMEDGSLAVGLFNRNEYPASITADWKTLGIKGLQIVRDLWRQKDLGEFSKGFTSEVGRHGVRLIRIRPAKINSHL